MFDEVVEKIEKRAEETIPKGVRDDLMMNATDDLFDQGSPQFQFRKMKNNLTSYFWSQNSCTSFFIFKTLKTILKGLLEI